jgi:[ribosomal protein S18]-alanine N-acetyltransferase
MRGASGGDLNAKRDVFVRPYRQEDRAAIEAILRNSPEAAQWSPIALLGSNQGVSGNPHAQCLLAEAGGGVAGFLLLRQVADEAEILNLAVQPAFRRSGLATALLHTAVKELSGLGVTAMFLEVRESNKPAIAFYAANEFAASGRRPSYYREPDEAALCMMRRLAGFRD